LISVRRLLFDDWRTKLIALVAAVGLWTYAYYVGTPPSTFQVPIRIGTPKDWRITREPRGGALTVFVRCPKRYQESVRQAVQSGEFRLAYEFKPGPDAPAEITKEIMVTREMFVVPDYDIVITGWEPGTVTFTATRSVTKKLRVKLVVFPPKGYVLSGDPWLWPEYATVAGPASALERVEEIRTAPIPIAPEASISIARTGEVEVEQFVELDGVRVPVSCEQKVRYSFLLRQEPDARIFEKVRVNVARDPSYPYLVRILRDDSEMKVTVSGPRDLVADLKPEQIFLYVDVNRLVPKDAPMYEQVQWVIRNLPPTVSPALFEVKLDKPRVGIEVKESSK